jgi:uncharacterized membrane protein
MDVMLRLLRGTAGHPSHPPMTDAAIGAYTAATILAILAAAGVAEEALAKGWWVTLLIGLAFGMLAALTGLLDWLKIEPGTPLKRSATTHMLVMVTATVLFLLAAIVGWSSYDDAEMHTGALVLVIVGYVVLAVGGWLGGAIVFVHGMRVLNLVDEPATRAAMPVTEEKEAAERS